MDRKKLIFAVLVILAAGVSSVSAYTPAAGGAPGYPPRDLAQESLIWEQVNSNGFGDPQAGEVSALAAFRGSLYAGTSNATSGARIYRAPDGAIWTPVTQPGFGIAHDIRPPAILAMTSFNGRLYASTGRGDGPGQIWRTLDGVNWAPMVIHGFGDPDTVDVSALAVYGNWLYAGVTNLISGAQIWRSYSGDNNTWTQVASRNQGLVATRVTGFAVFAGALYAAVESPGPAQIWRSSGGGWTAVVTNGFGDPLTTSTGGMAVFAGYLYVGAGNEAAGAQLWRTPDGVAWEPAVSSAFGDPNNLAVEMVFAFQNQLYAGVKNTQTGLELWRSPDGVHWKQANLDGFGDSHNSGVNGSNAVAIFQGLLYVGTANAMDGGEVWRMYQSRIGLPLVWRGP